MRALWLATALAIVFSAAVRWPALEAGFHQDDLVQVAMLEGHFQESRGLLDLYRFADLERDGRDLVDFGYLPWWSSPDLRIAMFRPLSSALVALDHHVFGRDAWLAHLHSLAWLVAAIAAAALLFGQVLPPAAAMVGVLLFALEEAHSVPLAWLCNRSFLIAETFATLALWVHVRARGSGRAAPRLLEAALFALAFAAGEYAVCLAAFVPAWEAFAAKGPLRARLLALAPATAATLSYFALRALSGSGTRGSGFYVDPTADPLAFVGEALWRVPLLASHLVLGDPGAWVEGSSLGDYESRRQALIGFGFVAMAAVGAASWWTARRLEPSSRAALWAFAAGGLLAVAPAIAAVPDDRLLGAPALGVSALLGVLVVEATRAAATALRRGAAVPALTALSVVTAVAWVHGVGAARRSHVTAALFSQRAATERLAALEAEVPDDPRVRVLFLNGVDMTTNAHVPLVRALAGHPLPRSFWRLSGFAVAHQITRSAANAIDVAVGRGPGVPMPGSLYRSADRPIERGDVVALDGVRVEVLEAAGGNPTRLRFIFDGSLDDGSYLFLHPAPRGLRRVRLPAVGQRIQLPPAAPPPGFPTG